MTQQLAQFADTVVGPNERSGGAGIALVETAGGVCSPGPSGTLQCDLLRPMRMPAILVGDGNLGGISTTLTSLDVLSMRGYDVVAVVVADGGSGLGNSDAVGKFLFISIWAIVLTSFFNNREVCGVGSRVSDFPAAAGPRAQGGRRGRDRGKRRGDIRVDGRGFRYVRRAARTVGAMARREDREVAGHSRRGS